MLVSKKKVIGYIVFILGLICFIFISLRLFVVQNGNKAMMDNSSLCEQFDYLYLHLLKLIAQGEFVLIWDNYDYTQYQNQCLKIDSILFNIKEKNRYFIDSKQIDSLRLLLQAKEKHLYSIKEALQSLEEADSLINELPLISIKDFNTRMITRKKKGIAGLYGKKETVYVPCYTNKIQDFNEKLMSVKDMHNSQIEEYVDSLYLQNKLLNSKIYDFISFINIQKQQRLAEYDIKTVEIKNDSIRLFVIVLVVTVIILSIIFLFIISFGLSRENKIKLKLQRIIQENEEQLEIRKKIILTVSHDIRGPIGNIRNCVDLASETKVKKKREIYLEDIRHSCHHILNLVNDLMDAYRINEASNLRNDSPFYLDQFLKRISTEFSRKAIAKALIFQFEHQNSSFIVKGDADKLEQVLANLLTNAIKFTPSGTIYFNSKYLEGKLKIEVIDTGIGMNEETLKRIFAPFERAAQNVNSEGFGLGLFLTKGLINVLGGTIDVESTPGKGSIFKVEFPLPESNELVEENKPDSDSITILPKNILVVDDDLILLKITEDMLSRKGINCTTCMNVKEVVAALEKSYYDIVLTDIQMPNTDGFSLLKLLRSSDIGNSRTIPVAVMTARNDGNTGIYEKEGFAGCIHKPFNMYTLLSFLSTVMSQTKVSQIGNFDFSYLLDNTDDYDHMLSLVAVESEKELEELRTAIKTKNRESMRKIIHRMMPVWEMFGREQILRDFQEQLYNTNNSDETVYEHAAQIIKWIEKLIKEAENELKKYENTNC